MTPLREKGTEHFMGVKPPRKHAQSYLSPSRLSWQTRTFPSLDIISSFCPQLAKRYPNMNLELQGRVVSAPVLNFSPGNLSLAPQMEVEGFVLLPNSARELIFQLGVVRFAFADAVPFSPCAPPSSPPARFLQISS